MNQIYFEGFNPEYSTYNSKDKYKIQKWRNSLQKYCDKMADEKGSTTGYCVCGYMKYCDFCKHAGQTNGCVKSICDYCKENNIQIDYDNFDFDNFIGEL